MHLRRLIAAFLVALLLPTLAFADGSVSISKAKYGKRWPFKVKRGVLACQGSNGVGAVTFTTGGKTYAVNGIARQKGLKPIDPIWRANPAIPCTKIDIGPIIERGLKLC